MLRLRYLFEDFDLAKKALDFRAGAKPVSCAYPRRRKNRKVTSSAN